MTKRAVIRSDHQHLHLKSTETIIPKQSNIFLKNIVFPDLVLDAMDSSGEQHLQIDHDIHKRRLDLNGNPIAEPKKEDIATAKTVMVSIYVLVND